MLFYLLLKAHDFYAVEVLTNFSVVRCDWYQHLSVKGFCRIELGLFDTLDVLFSVHS